MGVGQKLKILFLCTGNSCRSQMAEGWARVIHGESFEPYSAGIKQHGLNPFAVRVMREAGIDISRQTSKTVDDVAHVPFDVVVTVCSDADQTFPPFQGAPRVVHVGFDDPPQLAARGQTEEEQLPPYRRVRDEIRDFIQTLPERLSQ